MSADATCACLLCGCRFAAGERACAGCPLAPGCDAICCPNCRHTVPRSSPIASWLARWTASGWRRS